MATDPLFLSVDIEADGPIPGPHSMLSIGAVAIKIDGTIVDTFSANLTALKGASPCPDTMEEFWAKYPVAWAEATKNPCDHVAVMQDYRKFIDNLPDRPVFIGYPASFDHAFHHWYLVRFTGDDPCGHHALDLKTLAATMLKIPYRDARKSCFPERWFEGAPAHDHVALTDAMEQAIMGINMLREHYSQKPKPI